MSKKFEEIVLEKLESLENGMKDSNQKLSYLDTEVKDATEVIKYLNNNFTKFDFEINTKINTLFDSYKVNKEKHDGLDNKMNSIEKETFNHDIRISNLEDKVLIA